MAEPTPTSESGCSYCGLPLAAAAHDDGPRYCCFGCRFAASITEAHGEAGESRWMMTRLGVALFFTMNVMVFTMLLWSQRDGSAADPAATVFYGLARHACLLFSAPVLLLLGGPLFGEAFREVCTGRPSLNLLLAVGVAAAFLLSVHAVVTDGGHVYFEVACMVLVAVTLGKWLEASGKLETTAALRELRSLLPDRVRRIDGGSETEVPLASVAVGDRLRILPGERVATDGRIVWGRSAIDERTVTGESVPVDKAVGDPVASGTEVIDGPLIVEVTATAGAGTLERLIAAVTAAANAGTRQQRLAERVSAWFLPIVLVTAATALGIHWWQGGWGASGLASGTMAAIAVVVVSCPCALGLATPMALWAAIGAAARRHVLVRDGDAFARLGTARVFCFDKTGTLTTGLRVHEVRAAAGEVEPNVLAIAAALAHGSTHVLARAIDDEASRRGVAAAAVAAVRTVAGCGIEGRLADGVIVRLGSSRWIVEATGMTAVPDGSADRPECVLAIGHDVAGRITFDESIRAEAAATVAALARAGGEVWLLSGDREPRARAVAAALGMECRAALLPEEKLAFVQSRPGVVMVGDGINDAPALAAADVGVALGCGADVSRWTAAICLLRDDLADLPWLAALARRTNRTIRWNLLWAFGYNAACIPLAAVGWLHPAVAAAAMVASSLFVVTGSLALARPMAGDGETFRDAASRQQRGLGIARVPA
ncbi:MAG: cadmium-translocating P-type ATPase [Planctomycetia bacterium]|nr:cadmium-translocating P-type ATPase [Planctomycetia bacterium]